MKPEVFIKEITSPARQPIYMITGADPQAVERCLAAARDAVDPGFADFNYQIFDVDEGGWGQALGEASTMPFFVPPRMVVARTAGAIKAEESQLLVDYIQNPNRDSTLIMVCEKPDGRLKPTKMLKDAGVEVDCAAPKDKGLLIWLGDEFSRRGLSAGGETIRLMVDLAGSDLNTLIRETEKISLYLGGEGKATPEVVRKMVSLNIEGNIFELGDALARQDLPSAMGTLLELLSYDHPLRILAMLVRHFRIMLDVKNALDLNGGRPLGDGAAKELGLHPFVLKKNQAMVGPWPWPRLKEALKLLERAHLDLTSSPAPPETVIEALTVNLGSLLKAGAN